MAEPIYEYLGDGAYVKFDGDSVTLMANDHLNPTDKVVLDIGGVKNLIRFLVKVGIITQ